MSITRAPASFDTHDMVVVHRVFRREFALLPAMVRAVPPGDTRRAAVIAAHAREMINVLTHHHSAEDDFLWPRLRHRADLEAGLVERMEIQHERMAEILGPAGQVLEPWSRTADAQTQDRLAALLSQLPAALNKHLADEEAHILPVTADVLTAAEWQQLARRGMTSVTKPRLAVFLGHLLEETDPSERAAFLRHVPLPGRAAYRVIGRRRHAREIAAQRHGIDAFSRGD
ncbi:MAG: hemerythrin domain-containing protein [Actinomycetota bacterium]